jgi:hypothetical protein
MPCNAMHPIQDLFLEDFSCVLQIDMHFICTLMWTKYSLVKIGCYKHNGLIHSTSHQTLEKPYVPVSKPECPVWPVTAIFQKPDVPILKPDVPISTG